MPNTLTTRLTNKFPIYSQMRTDPSSFGARLFSVWSDYFEYQYIENKRLTDNELLFKHGLGIGTIYETPLLDDDVITYSLSASGEPIYVYPTSVVGDTIHTLTRVDDIDNLCWSLPNRLSTATQIGINNILIYSDDRNGNIVNNIIDNHQQLQVVVKDSTNFYKRTAVRNARASGKHLLMIKGKDVNGSSIVEYIDIPDDGHYQTLNSYSEIEEVIPEGFNGQIELSIGQALPYIVDPYRVCVVEDGNEGPLRLELSTQVIDSDSIARLRYFSHLERLGENYKDGINEINPNEIESWEQYLLDSSGLPFTPIDIAINPNSTHLYCLDSAGYIHIYKHGPSIFAPPTDQSSLTKTTYLKILPIKYYARYDEEMLLFTRFIRQVYPLQRVAIKRISPAGVTNYLQSDKTWSSSLHYFYGESINEGLPENTWNDIFFTNVFDEYGQWEFYALVKTKQDETVHYTAVMCDSLQAEVSINTNIVDPIGIWFNNSNQLVVTSDVNGPDSEPYSYYVFQEYSDKYLVDPINSILYTREYYSSLALSTNYTLNELSLPTGLDEIGLYLGLNRLDGESLFNYQRRLILETREPAGPTEIQFIKSLPRQIGEFDIPVFSVDLILDVNNEPLAEDPYIEITSSYLRAYNNYADEELDFELNLVDRDQAYFLKEIVTAFTASTYFDLTELVGYDEYYKSGHLRYSNTIRHVESELLLPTTENKLVHNHLIEIFPSNRIAFTNEKNAINLLQAEGDYFIDYLNGVLYTYSVQSSFISYTYREFPFLMYYCPIKSYPYVDVDKKYLTKDTLISDITGQNEYTSLNSYGALIANQIVDVHNLTWGS